MSKVESADTTRQRFLALVTGGVTLGVEITRIREILQYREPVTVLRVPAHIRGVINLRGSVVPVIDLATRLGIPSRPPGRKACIIIIDTAHVGVSHIMGIIVDAVHEVMSVEGRSIEPVPPFGGAVPARYLQGLTARSGGYIGLLDSASVFNLAELAAEPPSKEVGGAK